MVIPRRYGGADDILELTHRSVDPCQARAMTPSSSGAKGGKNDAGMALSTAISFRIEADRPGNCATPGDGIRMTRSRSRSGACNSVSSLAVNA